MKYFNNVNNQTEAKKLFRELCKLNHPDKGGSNEVMVEIIAEYEKVMKVLPKDGTNKNDNVNNENTYDNIKVSEAMSKVINNIAHIEGLDIEIIGCWIWVGGNTYNCKDVLKANGFAWGSAKKLWYWREEKDRSVSYGKSKDIEVIRSVYGSKKVQKEQRYSIAN